MKVIVRYISVVFFETQCTLCFFKNRTPETFYYNFAKIALIPIEIGTDNMHTM